MAWFGQVSVANILPKKSYYFLTAERIEQGLFELSSHDSVTVTNNNIKELPSSGRVFAIPRDILDKLKPNEHFVIKSKLIVGRKVHNFGEISLGNVLTESTWKYRQEPRFLTRSFVSCGEPCADIGKHIVVLSCGEVIPKFADEKVWEKLTKALNETFAHAARYTWPEFTVKSPDGETSVIVTVSLSKEIKDILTGKHTGTFTVPEKD